MDDQTKKNSMFKLHGSIKQGLQSVRSIGYDLASLASPNAKTSIMFSNKPLNQIKSTPPVDPTIDSDTNISFKSADGNVYNDFNKEKSIQIEKLARLALAERELERLSSSQMFPKESTGADIVMAAVTESIVTESYSDKLNQNKGN